jgi:hypothetical protein
MEPEKQRALASLYKDFSALTEKNKQGIIAMTKFLVRAQDDILPSLLKESGGHAMKGMRGN